MNLLPCSSSLLWAWCMDEESSSQAAPMLYPDWASLGDSWPQCLTESLARPLKLPSDDQKTSARH